MTETSKKRAGGCAARVAKRAVPVAVNPEPAGAAGGQYRPLTNADCHAIYDTALRLLTELGMGEVPARLWADLTAAGCNDLGGEGEFAKRPFMKTHISAVISPMRFGEDAVDVAYKCIEHNIPMSCITAAQAGATAPAALAACLAQSLAETLASLVMINVISPGFPMVFSNWPLVIDLRSGAFAGGGGEPTVLNAASAQLSNWLGLPSGVASSMTDAKAIDAQYGVAKGMTSLAAALAGGNLIYESSGMTAALLGASFEGFVLDDEMHAMTYRALRGIEVTDENLGFDAICASVLVDGHFLGADQTYRAMERDYHYPSLADREQPKTWEDAGAQTAMDRARQRVDTILDTHKPAYLSDRQDAEIRAAFPIID